MLNKKLVFWLILTLIFFSYKTISAQQNPMPDISLPIDLEHFDLNKASNQAQNLLKTGAEGTYQKINELLPNDAQNELNKIRRNIEQETVKQKANFDKQKVIPIKFIQNKFNQIISIIKNKMTEWIGELFEQKKQQMISSMQKQ